MKRLIVVVCCLFASQLFAGLELGVNLGYGFWAGGHLEVMEGTEQANNQYSSVEHSYVSLGDGIKIDVDGCYYFAEYFGVVVATGFSLLGGYSTDQTFVRGNGTSYRQLEEVSANFVPFTVGLRFRARTSLVDPYVTFAPGFFFPMNAESRFENETHIDSVEMNFNMGTGFASAAGILYRIRYDLFLRAELNATYAYAAVNEAWITEIRKSDNQRTVVIERYENDTPNVEPQELHSFSSVGLRVGLVKTF